MGLKSGPGNSTLFMSRRAKEKEIFSSIFVYLRAGYLYTFDCMTKVYLDNCCFNRPFDDQSSIRVKLETDARLYIQFLIRSNQVELVWSYIIDFENQANPFMERRTTIEKWKRLAVTDLSESDSIITQALVGVANGLKPKDALHLACAIEASCHYFLTTDDSIVKKSAAINRISVLNPVDFIKII